MNGEETIIQLARRLTLTDLEETLLWDDVARFTGLKYSNYVSVFRAYLTDPDESITKRSLITVLADGELGHERSVELLRELSITGINHALAILEGKSKPTEKAIPAADPGLEDMVEHGRDMGPMPVTQELSTEEVMAACSYKFTSQVFNLKHQYPEIVTGKRFTVGNLLRIYLQRMVKTEKKLAVLMGLGYGSLDQAARAVGIDNPHLPPSRKQRRIRRESEGTFRSYVLEHDRGEPAEPPALPDEIANKYPRGVPLDVLVGAIGIGFLSYKFFIQDKYRQDCVKLIPDRGTWRLILANDFFSHMDVVGSNVTGVQLAKLFKEYQPYRHIYDMLAHAKQKG